MSFITIHNLTYLTKCENLQNLDSPFCFLFEDFHLCSCYNNINYCTWYFYKRLFGSSFATSRLACSEFHFQLTKKARQKSRKWLTILQIGNHGVTTLAQLCVLYSYRVHSFSHDSEHYIWTLSLKWIMGTYLRGLITKILENFNNFSNVLFEAVKSSYISRVKEREGFRRELISVRDYNCMYLFIYTSRWTL